VKLVDFPAQLGKPLRTSWGQRHHTEPSIISGGFDGDPLLSLKFTGEFAQLRLSHIQFPRDGGLGSTVFALTENQELHECVQILPDQARRESRPIDVIHLEK
jgi:hypothetical protein